MVFDDGSGNIPDGVAVDGLRTNHPCPGRTSAMSQSCPPLLSCARVAVARFLLFWFLAKYWLGPSTEPNEGHHPRMTTGETVGVSIGQHVFWVTASKLRSMSALSRVESIALLSDETIGLLGGPSLPDSIKRWSDGVQKQKHRKAVLAVHPTHRQS